MAKAKIARLHKRLSRDDEFQGESFSIQHPKDMFEDYAQRNGFPRFKHFADGPVKIGLNQKHPTARGALV